MSAHRFVEGTRFHDEATTCSICVSNFTAVSTNATSTSNYNGSSVPCESAENPVPLALRITVSILFIVIIFVSVLGNSIVCYIVHQKPPMRSAINLMLANLAVSQILLSLVSVPLALTSLISATWLLGDVMCRISGFVHSLLVSESIMVLVAITLDRYMITVKRKDKLTPCRAKRLLIITWVSSAIVGLPPSIGWGRYQYYNGWPQCVLGQYESQADLVYVCIFFTIQCLLPAAVMTPAHVAILRNLRIQMRRVQNKPQRIAVISGNCVGVRVLQQQHHYSTTRVHMDINLKVRSFTTILILSLTFAACWMPYAITLFIWNLHGTMEDNSLGGVFVVLLSYLNCAANPLIYYWRIQKFRDACQEIVPSSLNVFSSLPQRAKRRIDPTSIYAA